MLELLRDFIMTPGVSGHEGPIRERIKREVETLGETSADGIGNLLLCLGTGQKHILLVAHMDEVGLMVAYVEKNGHIRLTKVGGPDDRVCIGRSFDILTANGRVPGVVGLTPPHLMKDKAREMNTVIPVESLVLDIGVRSDEEAFKLGVRMTDPVIFRKDFAIMNGKYVATRGLDDRAGCCALVCAAKSLAEKALRARVTFAWSVQEELGLRGGRVVSNLVKCDYVVPVDTCSTTDIPNVPYHYAPFRLGDGPMVRMVDRGLVASEYLRDRVVAVARSEGIAVQVSHSGGVTNGAVMQESGALVLPLCVPVRYTHSPVEVLHLDDLENIVKLLVAFVTDLASA